ncbi:hypothetical protein H0H92_003692, partial [Tricholoma furcatifolium]
MVPSSEEGIILSQENDIEHARLRRPRKRACKERYDPDDARRFIDIEAEVSHNEEGDDTQASDLDFINDDSSESEGETHVHNVSPSALPHLDNLEDESYASDDEWGSEEGIVGWDDDPARVSHNE